MHCVEEIGIPRVTYLSRRSGSGGDVQAIIHIGTKGAVDRIETDSPSADLAQEVRDFIRGTSKFKPDCQGSAVLFRFTFVIRGEPEWPPTAYVSFRPPNHFIIKTQPLRPRIQTNEPTPQ
jgi:hypothetical protein